MRITIFAKLLALILVLTVLPLSILGFMTTRNFERTADFAVEESESALNDIGSRVIRQKAEDVATQLAIYIGANPGMTVKDLQADPAFQALAVQPVGKTGYTAITDVDTLVCRFHKSPGIIDLDLSKLAEKLPGFWSVMSKSAGGVPSEGYYDWQEADGSIRQKYMYIAIVDAKTADGVTFSVAATTYIDEFSASAIATGEAINARSESMRAQMIGFIVFAVIVAVLLGFALARSITQPLVQMTAVGNRIAEGQLDAEIPSVRSNDELKDLSTTMGLLTGAIKYLKAEQKAVSGPAPAASAEKKATRKVKVASKR